MSNSEPNSSSPSPTLNTEPINLSPPTHALPTRSDNSFSFAPMPEDNGAISPSLADVNHELKTTLTDLLNCETVRRNGKMRLWIQSRLMEAEMELKRQRRSSTRRRESAWKVVGDDGRRESA